MSIERENWRSRTGFILAAIGSAIGLGNIWRFNYMAYENGGGAFLVPYIIALLTAGIPILMLEFGIGHKMRGAAPSSFFRIKNHEGSHFQTLGWWGVVLAMFGINLYYSVVISWCIRYFFSSFTLEWTQVANTGTFFFQNHLQVSDSMWDFTGPVWYILLGAALIWFINWFVTWKGVQSGIEKANKIFMPVLLVLVAILVIRGITLPGAGAGIEKYLNPDFNKLSDPQVWIDAYAQIFFTLSVGFGIMIAYSSYLPKKTNIISNAGITAGINSAFSLFAGFAVFGTLGHLAQVKNVPVDQVAEGGVGLAFVVFPEAIAKIPGVPEIFGMVFFLALIIAGLSSSMSLVEAFSSSVVDKFGWSRKKIVTLTCGLGFLGSIIFSLGNGIFWLDTVDRFMTSYGLVTVGLLECLVIGWIYGARNLRAHINFASERRMGRWFDISLKYITPIILLVVMGVKINNEIQGLFDKEQQQIVFQTADNKKSELPVKSLKKIVFEPVGGDNGNKISFRGDEIKNITVVGKAKGLQKGTRYYFKNMQAIIIKTKSSVRQIDMKRSHIIEVYSDSYANKKRVFNSDKLSSVTLKTVSSIRLKGKQLMVFIAGFLWLVMTGVVAYILSSRKWKNKGSLELGHHFEEGEDYHLH